MTDEGFVDWYLIRHAPVLETTQGIYRTLDGAADLSNEEALGAAVARLPNDARWFASPMLRTRQTADRLCELGHAAAAPIVEPLLREQSFGE